MKRTQLGYKYKWPGHSFYVFHNNSETSRDLRAETAYTRISWTQMTSDSSTGLGVGNYKKQLEKEKEGEWCWGSGGKGKIEMKNNSSNKKKRKKIAYTNKSHGIMS